jgi:hypothetical protein
MESYKFSRHFYVRFPPYEYHYSQGNTHIGLGCWLGCGAGWFVLLVGLRCWLVCVAGWLALLVGLRFALLVGLR